jgi:hypothetical protein
MRQFLYLSLASLSLPHYVFVPSAASAPPGNNAAQVVVEKGPDASLPDVLAHVRTIAGGEAWRKEGWGDPVVEGWLAAVVTAVREAGHGQDLADPVKFAAVKGRAGPDDLRIPLGPRVEAVEAGPQTLLVSPKNVRAEHVGGVVMLVDGDVQLGFAENCTVFATGSVYVAHGSGNVIVAGHFIHVSHDGSERSGLAMRGRMAARAAQAGRPVPVPPDPARGRPLPPASLLLTSGTLDFSHAGGAVCGAANHVEGGFAWGCVFLNSPGVTVSHDNGGATLRTDKVALGPPPRPHPLEADLRLHAAPGGHTAIFWHKNRRYVAEVNRPITNEAGGPVPDLEGWVLTMAADDFAILSNDKENCTAVMRRQRDGAGNE